MNSLRITLIGGPTALIEIDGFRLLTDPTFDTPRAYQLPHVKLEKLAGPALSAEAIGEVDAVLLSHDQHADNLDRAGRELLPRAGRVFTTPLGAERLGGGAVGLAPWQSVAIDGDGRPPLWLTGTPARHGPPGIEPLMGPVTGFLLGVDAPGDAIYITGDTVWYEGVAEVARRFRPRLVVLFAGSAEPRGRFHLTMDCNDAIAAAQVFPAARLVAVHTEGWAHFAESQADLVQAFAALGLGPRLQPLEPVNRVCLTL